MPRRRTLTQALAETRALAALRRRTGRTTRAQREALAPAPPSTTTYSAAMARLTASVDQTLDLLARGDLTFAEAEALLFHRVRRMTPAFAQQARLVTTHARREVGRILNLRMPRELIRERESFAQAQVSLVQRVMLDQLAKAREYQLLGRDIREAIWVTRNRGQLIARDQTWKYQNEEIREWSVAMGSEGYVYATAGDERVRTSHRPHDGKTFSWSTPPSTGHPGTEPNCRCRAIPVEVVLGATL